MDQRRWVVGTIAVLCTLGLCCGLACVGGFVLLGGRYRPCVPGRPAGSTVHDLAGRYRTAGGGELVLGVSGTLMSRGITIGFQSAPVTLSGRGTWSLLPRDEGFGDISLGFDEAQFAPT